MQDGNAAAGTRISSTLRINCWPDPPEYDLINLACPCRRDWPWTGGSRFQDPAHGWLLFWVAGIPWPVKLLAPTTRLGRLDATPGRTSLAVLVTLLWPAVGC